jgi:DNA-binding transcriptional LysR family regulator
MHDVTLRQLQIFAALARHLSFTRAAEALRLTQPAISMQVRDLEELAGLPLVERVGRKVALTAAGAELLRGAQEVMGRLEELEETFAALRGLKTGRLALAVASTAKYFALKLIALFGRRHPEIAVTVEVNNRDAVMRMILDNGVDAAIMGTPPPHLETTAFPFAQHPLVIIAAKDHPLAARRRVAAQALAAEAFIVREPGSGTRAAMERFFAAQAVRPASMTEMQSNESIKQAVMAGLGLGFISQHAIGLELAAGALVLLRVEGLPIVRKWNFVYRAEKRLAPAALAFKKFILREGKAFVAGWPA